MKLRSLAAACAAITTLAIAGSALAEAPITAKLTQPVAAKTKVVAGGAVFVCEGDSCLAQSTSSQTFASATCKTLAKTVGPIASFAGAKSLDDNRLAACNAAAGPATQVANR